jgi:hypothetical protein
MKWIQIIITAPPQLKPERITGYKVKVKFSPLQALEALRVVRG